MKEIQLNKGYVALVDDEDFERINRFKWFASIKYRKDGSIKSVYAKRNIRINGKRTSQLLHRFILGVTDSEVEVDHEDHNGLNNQRHNLRKASSEDNQHNRRIHTNNTSGYKGVSWNKTADKWVTHIGINGRRKYLGLFTSKKEAARAYDTAALKHFGAFAYTNTMLGLLPQRGKLECL